MAISSLALAVSMPAALVLLLLIFLDPCLVKRTQAFRQPCGSDEEAGADQATLQPATAQGGSIRRQPPGPGQPPRPGRSSRNGSNLSGSPITRAEKQPRQRVRIPPPSTCGDMAECASLFRPTRWSRLPGCARKRKHLISQVATSGATGPRSYFAAPMARNSAISVTV